MAVWVRHLYPNFRIGSFRYWKNFNVPRTVFSFIDLINMADEQLAYWPPSTVASRPTAHLPSVLHIYQEVVHMHTGGYNY